MLNRNLVEQIAGALATDEGLIEKDWHVVRAIGVLATLDHAEAAPAFSGGTSLSKGWGLIKRFSEDIDFKVGLPANLSTSQARARRRSYRERILNALTTSGFDLVGDPLVGNESRYFAANLAYPGLFTAGAGLRPHIRIEMSFHTPALTPIPRPIQSIIALAQKQPPEVASFPCVDPIETAADKLSALAWRVCTRRRGSENDDPAIIRHLHDLAALEHHITTAPAFIELVQNIAEADAGRGGGTAPADTAERLRTMLDCLDRDKEWAREYEQFVGQVSFAKAGESISFAEAFAATRRLIATVCKDKQMQGQ